jgi:hypothetical protein
MHKNTRRFYIVLQAFWQAENENQPVFATAKMPQKSRKLSPTRASCALQQNRWLRRVNTRPSEWIVRLFFLKQSRFAT